MKTLRKLGIAAAVGVFIAAGSMSSAMAAPDLDQFVPVESSYEADIRSDLEELAEHQTPAEAQEIWTSGQPASGLIGEDGEILAAMPTPEDDTISPFIVVPCGSGSTQTKVWLGSSLGACYGGQGVNYTSLSNVSSAWSGDRKITLKNSKNASTSIPANNSGHFSPYWFVTSITRH